MRAVTTPQRPPPFATYCFPTKATACCCSGRLHLHFGDVGQVELAVPCDLAKDGVLAVPSLTVVKHNEELGIVGVGHNLVFAVLSCTGHQAPAAQAFKRVMLGLIQPQLQVQLALVTLSGRGLRDQYCSCSRQTPATLAEASVGRSMAAPRYPFQGPAGQRPQQSLPCTPCQPSSGAS